MAVHTRRREQNPAALPMSAVTRTLVLWCPDWPVRAAITAAGLDFDAPVALIEKGLVFACSPTARRDGVRRGLRVREAQARCSRLVVLPYDPLLDNRAFEPLLAAVEQLMPGVQPIRPGICAIRSRGPGRYYGGEVPAAMALLALLAENDVPDARVGIADGPFAAEHAARRAGSRSGGGGAERVLVVDPGKSPAFLAALPVDVLADPALITLLIRLGMRTLGDVAGLGEPDLRSRFGENGTRIHALASGRDASTVVPRAPQRTLEKSVVFEPGLDRVDQVTFGFRSAADEFSAGVSAAGLVCTAIVVDVQAESGEVSERTWLHPRWFSAADVVDRVRWQLQGAGGIDAGLRSRIVRVTVSPESVDVIGNHEQGLWGDGPDERIHHALSRVQSMLGHEAVLTGVVGGGRLLTERQVLVPWGDRAPAETVAAALRPWPGALPSTLPATVFTPPRPVAVFAADGAALEVSERGMVSAEPAWFSWKGTIDTALPIVSWAGPWSVDERWWDGDQSRSVRRFHIVDDDGTAWLLLLDGHRWQAEARYD